MILKQEKGNCEYTTKPVTSFSLHDLIHAFNNYLDRNCVKYFLVFIRIRWTETGSHPYEKTMSSVVLYPAFYEYKNVQS